jgi:hypothetical protein
MPKVSCATFILALALGSLYFIKNFVFSKKAVNDKSKPGKVETKAIASEPQVPPQSDPQVFYEAEQDDAEGKVLKPADNIVDAKCEQPAVQLVTPSDPELSFTIHTENDNPLLRSRLRRSSCEFDGSNSSASLPTTTTTTTTPSSSPLSQSGSSSPLVMSTDLFDGTLGFKSAKAEFTDGLVKSMDLEYGFDEETGYFSLKGGLELNGQGHALDNLHLRHNLASWSAEGDIECCPCGEARKWSFEWSGDVLPKEGHFEFAPYEMVNGHVRWLTAGFGANFSVPLKV